MTAGARVTIAGAAVPSTWDGSELVALRNLRIKWGRLRAYDDPEPSVLTLSLIDRRGDFINDLGRVGQEVVVRMIDPDRAVFRGAISKPKARRARVYNPGLKADETVWVVTLTAVDPLAALSMAVYPGDAHDGWREGAGGWAEIGPTTRLQRLFDAGARELVDGIEPPPPVTGATPGGLPTTRRLGGQLAADARTALELIQQAYRTIALCVAAYDPETHTVKANRIPATSPVRLARRAGKVVLSLDAGLIVPASRVGVAGYDLESEVDSAIDVVQVAYWWYGKDPDLSTGEQKRTAYIRGFIEGRAARYNPRTRRVLRVETELITFDPTEFAGDVAQYNRYPEYLRNQLLQLVDRLNGQLRLPTLILDAQRAPLPADLEAILYRPIAQPVPVYFAGSVFNGMQAVGPQFHVVGGTLAYDGGWTHEMTVAAAGPAAPSTLTLAQSVTDPTVTLGDFDPDISLADLGMITTGLA